VAEIHLTVATECPSTRSSAEVNGADPAVLDEPPCARSAVLFRLSTLRIDIYLEEVRNFNQTVSSAEYGIADGLQGRR